MEEVKNNQSGQTFLNFIFGLLTIFIHLELNIPAFIEKHLEEVKNSLPVSHNLLATFLAAIIITTSSFLFIWIYKRIWWPFWGVYNSRRGLWLYGLIDERNQATTNSSVMIFGKFFLDHKVDSVEINSAMAYYVTDDGQKIDSFRAHWEADDIVIKKGLIKIDYLVKNAQASDKHFTPVKYEGRMTLKEKSDSDLIVGKNKFDGHIVDLSVQDDFSGWIYCERLSFWKTYKLKEVSQDYLNQYVPRFIKRAKSMTPTTKQALIQQQNIITNGSQDTK